MSWFEEADREKLKKLGVNSFLDLALNIPTKYENNYLTNRLEIGKEAVLEVAVLDRAQTPKFLKVRFFSPFFDREIGGIIFHPKAFHKKLFCIGCKLFVKGKIEKSFGGKVTIVQPKSISDINSINVKYKTKLKNQSVKELVKKYVTIQNLLKSGLKENEAKTLYSYHFPKPDDLQRVTDFRDLKTLKYIEAFNYFRKLSRKRKRYPSSALLDGKIDDFIKSLGFELTNDQKRAIKDIQKDLSSSYAAKRVIMGDVGCGKTIVMLCAVVMAYPKRSVLMAPTSVLAHQLFSEAKKFLPKNIKTTLVTKSEERVLLDEYDFIIGTHALLYREIPRCDLVMVDEQHRFGVAQREMINKLSFSKDEKRAHFLQFSATPIPRTMALMNSSLVDYTFIKEMPFKKDITTKIIGKSDFKALLKHIESELSKSHQIIIVYPLVEESEAIDYQSIEEAREYWLKRYKSVYVTYGKDKLKDETLKDFRDKGAILISTTVIEVGISLPKLSTIVIVGAERLGFATLHQLRGRVGRVGLKGYCFLYTHQKEPKRLKEFAKTTNGFDIAELDLKYRQSGDVIDGKLQSGTVFRWIDLSKDEEVLKRAKLSAENPPKL